MTGAAAHVSEVRTRARSARTTKAEKRSGAERKKFAEPEALSST
jgi:hypothetical protein